jgi:hypothetical protein
MSLLHSRPVFASLLLAILPVAASAQSATIQSAVLDHTTRVITINGVALAKNDKPAVVTLNGVSVPATYSATNGTLAGQLATIPSPGTYLLTVGHGGAAATAFNLTIGATGLQGVAGPLGPTGPAGATGPAGVAGAVGPQGAPGPQGIPGPVGAKGESGAPGIAGPAGPTGATGAVGATGPAGATGVAGSVGPVGPQGPVGPAGANGINGTNGAIGATGATGAKGETGATGPAGASPFILDAGNAYYTAGDVGIGTSQPIATLHVTTQPPGYVTGDSIYQPVFTYNPRRVSSFSQTFAPASMVRIDDFEFYIDAAPSGFFGFEVWYDLRVEATSPAGTTAVVVSNVRATWTTGWQRAIIPGGFTLPAGTTSCRVIGSNIRDYGTTTPASIYSYYASNNPYPGGASGVSSSEDLTFLVRGVRSVLPPRHDTLFVEAGNVGIGTTSPQYTLDVNGTIRGTVVAPSDERLKRDIKPLQGALETVMQLEGHTYFWTESAGGGGALPGGRQVGFVAQQVERVAPELVYTDAQGGKSVLYQSAVPLLVEAVKELREENRRLRDRLEALEQP